jgi:hypothetical protein
MQFRKLSLHVPPIALMGCCSACTVVPRQQYLKNSAEFWCKIWRAGGCAAGALHHTIVVD